MTVKELIEKLLNYPLDSEVKISYTVTDDDGEEYTLEEEPSISMWRNKVYLL